VQEGNEATMQSTTKPKGSAHTLGEAVILCFKEKGRG